MIREGTTFWLGGSDSDPEHLYFVFLVKDGKCAVANMTTWRTNGEFDPDGATVLESGDHPGVRKKSFILYAEATVAETAKLARSLNDPSIRLGENCSNELIARIKRGALSSHHANPAIKQFCRP